MDDRVVLFPKAIKHVCCAPKELAWVVTELEQIRDHVGGGQGEPEAVPGKEHEHRRAYGDDETQQREHRESGRPRATETPMADEGDRQRGGGENYAGSSAQLLEQALLLVESAQR